MSAGTAPASRRAVAPSSRFSDTVRLAKICRPSGTSAMPCATTSSSAIPPSDLPANVIVPAAGVNDPGNGGNQRGLAGAVRADDADDLALVDLQIDAAHGGDGAIPHDQAGDGEQRRT